MNSGKLENDSTNSVFVEFNHCTCGKRKPHDSEHVYCRSGDHWSYALEQVRKSAFGRTSASISPPAYHVIKYEQILKRKQQNGDLPKPLKPVVFEVTEAAKFQFNSDPFATKDIFSYRQMRSEHLLLRMVHFSKQVMTHSFVRLSKGVFLVQKWEMDEDSVSYPSPSAFDNALEYYVEDDDVAPVDTFTFNSLFNDMMEQTRQQKQEQEELQKAAEQLRNSFVPYTYTLGVRFTNPYNHMRDIVVCGRIPLWCQSLIITECLRYLPIRHGQVLTGLLPFAKDITFTFGSIPTKAQLGAQGPNPDILVMFECFAMELADPSQLFKDNTEGEMEIRNKILFCYIPNETANIITALGNEWAISQGISLQ